jgi:hypothetical protein
LQYQFLWARQAPSNFQIGKPSKHWLPHTEVHQLSPMSINYHWQILCYRATKLLIGMSKNNQKQRPFDSRHDLFQGL